MNQINCKNCQKDLSLAKLENYQKEKDLLICVQCYFKQKESYQNYEITHFPLFRRNGKIEGSSEAIVIWDLEIIMFCFKCGGVTENENCRRCSDNNLHSSFLNLSPVCLGF